jgi:SAM-dependent methyltransferase
MFADFYEELVDISSPAWVNAAHSRLLAAGWSSALVLDAGCGTGRHAADLIAQGHTVDLADISAELLAQAELRCPGSRSYLADLCTLHTGLAYQAVTCRGVLNDIVGDAERDAAICSLAGNLRDGGLLMLDVRHAPGARSRADGVPRQREARFPEGRLTFTNTPHWRDGTIRVLEEYELFSGEDSVAREDYEFVMRPWTRDEIYGRLQAADLSDIKIESGIDRRTDDRWCVLATR